MDLELASVLACSDAGCRVRYLSDGTSADAHYSDLVRDGVWNQGMKFGRCHVVMIDRSVDPPEIVYRVATMAEVKRLEGAGATLYRQELDDARDWQHTTNRLVDARADDDRQVSIGVGDVVVSHHGRLLDDGSLELDVLDLAVDGRPMHPERLYAAALPHIAALYGERSTKGAKGE